MGSESLGKGESPGHVVKRGGAILHVAPPPGVPPGFLHSHGFAPPPTPRQHLGCSHGPGRKGAGAAGTAGFGAGMFLPTWRSVLALRKTGSQQVKLSDSPEENEADTSQD